MTNSKNNMKYTVPYSFVLRGACSVMLSCSNTKADCPLISYMTTDGLKQYLKVVDDVVQIVQENNKLRVLIASLRKEYAGKITEQNGKINELSKAYRKADQDAGDFAEVILKSQSGEGQG